MGDKTRVEEWYAKIDQQFQEDKKSHAYGDAKMDKWFAEKLDKEMSMETSEEQYEKINRQFEEDRQKHEVVCPDCGKHLSVKDGAMAYRCPACGGVFQLQKTKKLS